MNEDIKVTVVIPNYNGMKYVENCFASLYKETDIKFETILVDNGSTDGSLELIRNLYPQVKVIAFPENLGFCRAVNTGIINVETEFVILLNNDTKIHENFIYNLVAAIEKSDKIFSVSSKMLDMNHPDIIDDCGDLYCGLGWAFGLGKGKTAKDHYTKPGKIFAACGGASIYRKEVFEEIGYFDENHFAYLEDIDVGYRGKIYGYENWFCPEAKVYHAGSGFSGSRYNQFKIQLSGKNNIYLIYKNMPLLQILLNSPLIICGILIKTIFFIKKGFGKEYLSSVFKGIAFCMTNEARVNKVNIKKEHCINYVTIQIEIIWNILRKIIG